MASVAVLGSMAAVPAAAYGVDQHYVQGEGIETAWTVATAELADLDAYNFVPVESLSQLDASRQLTEAEIRSLMQDPTATMQGILEGRIPMQYAEYLQGRQIVDRNGNERTVTALPTTFTDGAGNEIGTYYPAIVDYNTGVPSTLTDIITVSEGTPENNENPDIWLAKIGYRMARGFQSGASDISDQVVGMLANDQNGTAPINPDAKAYIYNTRNYNDGEYRGALHKALRHGEVPQSTVNYPAGTHNEMVEPKEESLLWGRRIWHQHGSQEVTRFYTRNVDMGSISGQRIIGLPAASEVWFGKNVNDLSLAEQYMLTSMIPMAQPLIDSSGSSNYNDMIEQARVASLGKVDLMMEQGNLSEADAAAIKTEINNMAVPNPEVPLTYQNQWLNQLPPGQQERILSIAHATPASLARHMSVEMGDSQLRLNMAEYEYSRQNDRELYGMIENGMQRREEDGVVWWENPSLTQDLTPGEVRQFPSTYDGVPGLGVVVVGADNAADSLHTLAEYDRTPGTELINGPEEVGSTMKPLVFAFLREQGVITGPEQMTSDVSTQAGTFNPDFVVRNATADMGSMTFENALRLSRNVPFQEAFNDYLYEGIPRVGWGELTPEQRNTVEQRWGEFQNFLGDYGLRMVNIAGEPITNPADPANPSETPTLGTGMGALLQSTTSESTLAQLAKAYISFEDPERFGFDPDRAQILREVGDILSSFEEAPNLRSVYGDQRTIDLLTQPGIRKTGTVEQMFGGVPGVPGVMTVNVERDATGRVRAVVSHIRSLDENGIPQNMLEDEATTGMGLGSGDNALPTAIEITNEAMGWGSR